MEEKKKDAEARESFIFLHLVHSFENAALIGLGKLPNPNGDIKVELEAASYAIDMLDMLSVRTRGNLKPEEKKYMEQTLGNLKLNYLTEIEKLEKKPKTEEKQDDASSTDKT
ncbi:DUF1844 domain-containing protein [bacterium]|nr:DUF1844 domain-containing protein [bacterium]MBU1937931.1 DUF1844 domain-containing protein [bacterium]